MVAQAPLLEVDQVCKKFPGVKANDNVSLTLERGEVRALLGENGAGKSTLVKIIMGILVPDSGALRLVGEDVQIRGAHAARLLGIHAVFQELSQISTLSVAENIFIANERRRAGIVLNREAMFEEAGRLLESHGIDVDPRATLGDLPLAKRQLVEIVKATADRPRVLILDEPTSALTDAEAETLYGIVAHLKASGTGIIYITHRLNEVTRVADSVSILRDGRNVAELDAASIDVDVIVTHMVGREVDLYTHVSRKPVDYTRDAPLLAVADLSESPESDGASFELNRGEILGIAGLVGSGRSELMQMVFGVVPAARGSIRVEGRPVKLPDVKTALRNGIAMIPENRHVQGLNLSHSVASNISLPLLGQFTRFGIVVRSAVRNWVDGWIERLDIRTDSREKLVKYLSGGNQQKVVIAKWLSTSPKVLIVDEPTAGIDVGSKNEIHKHLRSLADDGLGIVLISSDMPELLALSDRILVMNRSRIIGVLGGASTQEQIMSLIMKDNMET